MGSNPYLEWVDERHQHQRIKIEDRLCIGRTCKGVAPQRRILLEDRRISRVHAEITWTAGQLQIVDSGRNGTWVNNTRMAAGSSRDLIDGDTIRVGEYLFRVAYPQQKADAAVAQISTEMTMVSPVAEEATILVADVRGFTAYAQSHSSADVHGMIKQIFIQFTKIVEETNGTIKDFAGDAVFAFWEHHFEDAGKQSILACKAAERQLRSFLDLRREMTGKYADIETLQIGWGISNGPIVLSHFGSRAADLAMVGDCVNLASRLAGMAKKDVSDHILLCARTAEFVENTFSLKDLGLHPIRGRQGEEHIYALAFA